MREQNCEASRGRKDINEVVSITTERYKLICIKEAITGIDGMCSCQKQKHKKSCVNNTHSD